MAAVSAAWRGVGVERVGGGGADRGALPRLGVLKAGQHPARQPRLVDLEGGAGLVELVAEHPVQHRVHPPIRDRGGVKQRGEQRAGAL